MFTPKTNLSAEVVILQAGQVVNSRGVINSLGHLVLEDVQQNDEGVYTVKDTSNPSTVRHLILLVSGKMSQELLLCMFPLPKSSSEPLS